MNLNPAKTVNFLQSEYKSQMFYYLMKIELNISGKDSGLLDIQRNNIFSKEAFSDMFI